MKLTITLVGSEGMYEKVLLSVRRFNITPLGDVNIWRGEVEFITYSPDEWSELDVRSA